MAREYVWYEPDHKSFGALMVSDQMRAVTVKVANAIADTARELAPKGETGELAASIRVNKDAGVLEVGGNLRVRVDVVADVRYAAIIEFGSNAKSMQRNVKKTRFMARAGAAHGELKQPTGPKEN